MDPLVRFPIQLSLRQTRSIIERPPCSSQRVPQFAGTVALHTDLFQQAQRNQIDNKLLLYRVGGCPA